MTPLSYIFSFWIWVFALCFVIAMLNNYRRFPAPIILSSIAFIFLTIVNFILPLLNVPIRAGTSTAAFSLRFGITLFETFISMLVVYLYITCSKLPFKQNTYYEILYVGIYLVWLYQNNTNPIQIYFYDVPAVLENMSLMNWLSTFSYRQRG